VQTPETLYAERPDGVTIAYQVLGEGPVNLVFCAGFVSHLDLQWTNPAMTRFFRRLASFGRLALYDKAGTGLSDPVAEVSTLEERMEEVRTVMDAAGMERAALFGESEGGPSAIMFAATYPERVAALVLYGSFPGSLGARPLSDADRELAATYGVAPELVARRDGEMAEVVENWGQGRLVDLFMPSLAGNKAARTGIALFERASVSPRMAHALVDAVRRMDVSAVAETVTVPTLVLHRRHDWIPIGGGRYLADVIPGARFVELHGTDHAYFTQDSEAILEETQRFLTGTSDIGEPDRVLATVLFTDIVDSTARAAALGDARWRELLERHDALVREHVEGAGGRVVKSTGDGALAAFTGPARAIRSAQDLLGAVEELGLEARAGVHTGECEAIGDDLAGLAVHIGARVAARAQGGEVLVSSTVKDLVVGSKLEFSDRGEHELKGIPGTWRIYALAPRAPAEPPLEPAADHMTAADRATVRVARRAPGLLRTIGRLTMRERTQD
jgi:class 3 adenylate cyclase